jgi:hypothetical protein
MTIDFEKTKLIERITLNASRDGLEIYHQAKSTKGRLLLPYQQTGTDSASAT